MFPAIVRRKAPLSLPELRPYEANASDAIFAAKSISARVAGEKAGCRGCPVAGFMP